MQDRPKANDLLAALGAFLDKEVAPELSGHKAFNMRVAINVLAIVQREAEFGAQFAATEKKRLCDLLDTDSSLEQLNEKLCDEIRAAHLDLSSPRLVHHLKKVMMGKLAIDQPRYAGYRMAIASGWPEEDQME